MRKTKEQKGITLVALVVTIIVLLILAGVTISALGGNDGLIAKVEKARKEQMKAEAKENINMAIIQIQTEETPKGNKVTLQTLNDKLNEADNRIKPKKYKVEDTELKGTYTVDEKTKFTFIIDEKLNVKVEEAEEGAFPITVDNIETSSLRVNGDVSGLQTQIANYTYVAQTSTSNQIKFENITETSYTVTGLEPGTEYDVYMLAYDKAGNAIKSDVETVTTKAIPEGIAQGAIIFGETTWTNGKVEVTISTNETNFYIEYQVNETNGTWTKGTSIGASVTVSNLNNNDTIYARLTDGTYSGKYATLTIADIEGPEEFTITVTNTSETSIKIEGSTTDTASGIKDYTYVAKTTDGVVVNTKEHTTDTSYEVTGLTNGRKYTVYMIAYDNAGNETKSNEKTIIVQEAINYATEGVVAYDAGKWTQTEINNLGSLYNYNSSHTGSSSLQFTFGGFKAGDSRNTSVAPRMGAGDNRYEGWIILESEVKNEKTYIKSIVHAGAPENFVYDFSNKDTSGLTAEYILSSGTRQTSYKTSKGSRNWDMYKDQSKLNFINNVYCLTLNDVNKIEQNDIRRRTGGNYFLATNYKFSDEEVTLRYCNHSGSMGGVNARQGAECFGVRPVVTFVDGVYAVSGTGTGDDPYILGIDN